MSKKPRVGFGKKVVGFAFVLMCPIVGGNLAVAMALEAAEILNRDQSLWFLMGEAVAWIMLWSMWFDGSDIQHSFTE